MSHRLESLLDRQRRLDCAAHDFALTSAREIRASGNHLAAQNDEPEPDEQPRRLPLIGERVCKVCHNSGHNCPECSGWED